MPTKRPWTQAQDETIRRTRRDGATWDAIATALGTSRNAVIERGRRIGARRAPPPPADPAADAQAALRDPAREPMPPGHPVAWGAITAGTSLDGHAYPWPPLPTAA